MAYSGRFSRTKSTEYTLKLYLIQTQKEGIYYRVKPCLNLANKSNSLRFKLLGCCFSLRDINFDESFFEYRNRQLSKFEFFYAANEGFDWVTECRFLIGWFFLTLTSRSAAPCFASIDDWITDVRSVESTKDFVVKWSERLLLRGGIKVPFRFWRTLTLSRLHGRSYLSVKGVVVV